MNRDTASLFDKIKLYIPEDRLFRDEPMHRHTTFRVGGRASLYVRVASSDELIQVINTAKSTSTDFFLIGNGSNLLVSDDGFDGIIIELGEAMSNITVNGSKLTCESGALLSRISSVAAKHALEGLEFASGIPGTQTGLQGAGSPQGRGELLFGSLRPGADGLLPEDVGIKPLRGLFHAVGIRSAHLPSVKCLVLSYTIGR